MLSRSVFGSSLAGDAMLVRLRSTSIALLALVTAIGLGLVAFISQLGWPGMVNSPIPSNPTEAGAVHNAIALTHSPGATAHSPRRSPRSRTAGTAGKAAPTGGHAVPARDSDPGVGGSRQLGGSPTGQAPTAEPQPTSVPVSQPTGAPPVTTPAPSASPAPVVAVAEPPRSPVTSSKDSSASSSKPGSPSSGPSTAKVKSDSVVKAKAPSPGRFSGKDSHYSAPSQPSGYSAGKAAGDAAGPPSAAVPPPPTATKDVPEVPGYGTDKEARDAEGSDGLHH
jgi:hypothetical protein